MKKASKIVVALFIVLAIVSIGVSSFAEVSPGDFTPADIQNVEGITKLGQQIVGVVRTVGVLVAVVILLILGIKYMVGSAEEKADYKKSMIPYLVGAILIFASTTIVGVVYDMVTALNTSNN